MTTRQSCRVVRQVRIGYMATSFGWAHLRASGGRPRTIAKENRQYLPDPIELSRALVKRTYPHTLVLRLTRRYRNPNNSMDLASATLARQGGRAWAGWDYG